MDIHVAKLYNVCRVKCQTTQSKPGGTSTDLVIPIYRDGSVEVAILPGVFRYAVSGCYTFH